MENLDATILTTGLPTMARDFHVTAIALNTGITAYLLALAVLIPVSGWVAERIGERRTFAAAVLVFTLASVCCAFSRSLPAFLLSRIAQGFGGAMMVPVGRLMVVRSASKQQLMKAIAFTIWPALTAPILGPFVGGWIIRYASWPWMFLLNVPIGLMLFVAALLTVQDRPREVVPALDKRGVFLTGAASVLWILGLESFQDAHLAKFAPLLLVAGGVSAVAAAVHMRRSPRPLFPPALFHIDTFRTVMGAGSLFRMAVFSVPFLLPLLFQTALGLDALQSGSLVMAVFAGNLAMKPLTTPLLRGFGFRDVLLCNGVLTVLLLALCGWLHQQTPVWLILLVLFLGGAGRSLELTALTTLGFSDLPAPLTSSGTTFATMVQQLTVSVGVSIAALLLRLTAHRGHGDFRIAFLGMSAIAGASLIWFARLPADAGALVSGRTRSTAAEAVR